MDSVRAACFLRRSVVRLKSHCPAAGRLSTRAEALSGWKCGLPLLSLKGEVLSAAPGPRWVPLCCGPDPLPGPRRGCGRPASAPPRPSAARLRSVGSPCGRARSPGVEVSGAEGKSGEARTARWLTRGSGAAGWNAPWAGGARGGGRPGRRGRRARSLPGRLCSPGLCARAPGRRDPGPGRRLDAARRLGTRGLRRASVPGPAASPLGSAGGRPLLCGAGRREAHAAPTTRVSGGVPSSPHLPATRGFVRRARVGWEMGELAGREAFGELQAGKRKRGSGQAGEARKLKSLPVGEVSAALYLGSAGFTL